MKRPLNVCRDCLPAIPTRHPRGPVVFDPDDVCFTVQITEAVPEVQLPALQTAADPEGYDGPAGPDVLPLQLNDTTCRVEDTVTYSGRSPGLDLPGRAPGRPTLQQCRAELQRAFPIFR